MFEQKYTLLVNVLQVLTSYSNRKNDLLRRRVFVRKISILCKKLQCMKVRQISLGSYFQNFG